MLSFFYTLERVLKPNTSQFDDSDSTMFSIMCVPYYGSASLKFSKHLSNIIADRFDIDIKVVYSTFKVKNYLGLKCKTPLLLLSNVIYKYECVANTHISYI